MFARRSFARFTLCLLAFLASSAGLLGQGKRYHIEVPEYQANAGKPLTVPIILHEASGLARVRVQVNFNAEVIVFDSVDTGPLGELFDFEYELDANTLTLDFTRAEDLVSGSGHLARIKFIANAGASSDLYSDLAIATFEIGDESGVTDLAIDNTIVLENGSVHVSVNPELDNTGNGLPDWWEEAHALNPFNTSATSDEDGDSIINKFELAFGGNPNARDSHNLLPFGAVSEFDSKDYFTLKFRRRADQSDGFTFRLYESTDLAEWHPRAIPDLRIHTVDLGNGMEQITVRGSNPMTGPDSEPKCFLKLEIE